MKILSFNPINKYLTMGNAYVNSDSPSVVGKSSTVKIWQSVDIDAFSMPAFSPEAGNVSNERQWGGENNEDDGF